MWACLCFFHARMPEHIYQICNPTNLACWFVVSLYEAVFQIVFCLALGNDSDQLTDWSIGGYLTRTQHNRYGCVTQKVRYTSPICAKQIWSCRQPFVVVHLYRGFVQIGFKKHHVVSCRQFPGTVNLPSETSRCFSVSTCPTTALERMDDCDWWCCLELGLDCPN